MNDENTLSRQIIGLRYKFMDLWSDEPKCVNRFHATLLQRLTWDSSRVKRIVSPHWVWVAPISLSWRLGFATALTEHLFVLRMGFSLVVLATVMLDCRWPDCGNQKIIENYDGDQKVVFKILTQVHPFVPLKVRSKSKSHSSLRSSLLLLPLPTIRTAIM